MTGCQTTSTLPPQQSKPILGSPQTGSPQTANQEQVKNNGNGYIIQSNQQSKPIYSQQPRKIDPVPQQAESIESSDKPQPLDNETNISNVEEAIPPKPTNDAAPTKPVIDTKQNPNQRSETETKSVTEILIDQARQNSKSTKLNESTVEDGDNIPAFRSLMNKGVNELRQGQTAAAQSTFTRAQRLAPQSSAVYFYLGQVALKQNQPLKAEAMARRGLVVAKTKSRKTGLWQIVLKAAQLRGNKQVINEAKTALAK